MVDLALHQLDAVGRLRNGSILRGDVGSGKSRCALLWYCRRVGAQVPINGLGTPREPADPKPLYIITTAKKRDDLEWERELALFGMSSGDSGGWAGAPITVDSWNNIRRHSKVYGAVFIFDEQRLVGSGAWTKAFYQIARKNSWIILTATPGDDWKDYIPVFVANRFYKNKTAFMEMHAIYARWANYPKVEGWRDELRLQKFKDAVLVEVEYVAHTTRHLLHVPCSFDKDIYDTITKDRWNPWENKPIETPGELCLLERRAVNSHPSRLNQLERFVDLKSRTIVFYNFNYELEILRSFLELTGVEHAEWNGHKHQDIPQTDSWTYLVQYTAGSEGWNCISTDTILYYSLTYSYKQFAQAQGRIDRMNTPYSDLYYQIQRSMARIDRKIWECLRRKKNFNETRYLQKEYPEEIWDEDHEIAS